MGLEKYYQFMLKPNTKTFMEFINNISELKKVHKVTKQNLQTIVNLLKQKHLDSNGELKIKSNRKGPLLSATCFPLDFKLPTEKQLWITKKIGDKQVWKLYADYDFKQTYNKSKNLESFQFNKKTLESEFKLEKIENKLNTFGGKLAIGELSMYFEKVKSKYYSIWLVGGTLIAVPYGTSKDSILKAKWKFTGYGIPVDGGTFGFHNGSMFNYMANKTVKGKQIFGEYINSEYTFLNVDQYKSGHYWIEIYGKDLAKLKFNKLDGWVTENNLEKELVGFYCSNSYGDGFFDVYKAGDMYLILNPRIYWLIHKLHIDYFNF